MSVILQYQKQFKLKKTTTFKKYLRIPKSVIIRYLKILSPTEKQLKHSQFRKKHKIQIIPGTPRVCNSTLSKTLPILKKDHKIQKKYLEIPMSVILQYQKQFKLKKNPQNPKNTWEPHCL